MGYKVIVRERIGNEYCYNEWSGKVHDNKDDAETEANKAWAWHVNQGDYVYTHVFIRRCS